MNSLHARIIYIKFEWNLPTGSREFFLYNNNLPYCGPIQPLGTMILINFKLHNIRKLSCKSQLFWPSGSREKDFKWPYPTCVCACFWLSPLWRGHDPLFVSVLILCMQRWFVLSLIEIGQLVLEKIFKDFFFNINTYKNDFLYCYPSRPTGSKILTNFVSTLIQKTFIRFELF
jgi:hypothetical protein